MFDLARSMGPPRRVRTEASDDSIIVIEYASSAGQLEVKLAAGGDGGLRGFDFRQTSPGEKYRQFHATLDDVVMQTLGKTPVITKARHTEVVVPADPEQQAYTRILQYERPADQIKLSITFEENDFRFRNPPPPGTEVMNLDGHQTGLSYSWTGNSLVQGYDAEAFQAIDAAIDEQLAARTGKERQRPPWIWWATGAGGAIVLLLALWLWKWR